MKTVISIFEILFATKYIADVTTSTNTLVVHLYVEAPPNGTYSSSIVPTSSINACNVTSNNVTASDGNVTVGNVTIDPNSTVAMTTTTVTSSNVTTSVNVDTTTQCQSVTGPFINFTVDFTSYFIGTCRI